MLGSDSEGEASRRLVLSMRWALIEREALEGAASWRWLVWLIRLMVWIDRWVLNSAGGGGRECGGSCADLAMPLWLCSGYALAMRCGYRLPTAQHSNWSLGRPDNLHSVGN